MRAEFFKARVQPIFLKKRDNHVRCYVCHSEATNAFKLVHMEKGQTAYTEEDTRKNFETVSRLVVSKLINHADSAVTAIYNKLQDARVSPDVSNLLQDLYDVVDIAVSTEVTADVESAGAITIPARKLSEIARELPPAPPGRRAA